MTESQQFTCLIHRPRCRDLRIDLKLGSNGGPQQASAFDLGCRANQLHNIGVWRAWKPKLFEVLPSHAKEVLEIVTTVAALQLQSGHDCSRWERL